MDMNEKLYTMKEAARILQISLPTIRRAEAAGKLRVIRTPGGRRRIPESEIKRLMGVKEDK